MEGKHEEYSKYCTAYYKLLSAQKDALLINESATVNSLALSKEPYYLAKRLSTLTQETGVTLAALNFTTCCAEIIKPLTNTTIHTFLLHTLV